MRGCPHRLQALTRTYAAPSGTADGLLSQDGRQVAVPGCILPFRVPAADGVRADRPAYPGCPTARPTNQAARVTWAPPQPVPRSASMAGKAGRYMSVETGPMAVR